MKISQSNNLLNSLWNLFDVLAYPAVFLGFTPFFIERMGAEEFGLWMLVNSILVSFQLLNFGLGAATQRNVARYLGKNDRPGMWQSINTNLSLGLVLLLICMAVGGILILGVRQVGIFNLDPKLHDRMSLLLFITSILVALKFIEQIAHGALKGLENFQVPARINLVVRFSILLANIQLVSMGYDLEYLFGSNLLITFSSFFIYYIFIKKHLPGYTLQLIWEKSSIVEELKYGLHNWVQSVSVILTYQFDRFIVTSVFGLATLSYYSIVATMFNHIHMAYNSLVPWLLPKVARLREEGAELNRLFLTARSFTILAGISSLLVFQFISPALLTLWLGVDLYLKIENLVNLYCVFELFFIFTSARYFFLNGSGYERLLTRLTLQLSAITILAMLVGLWHFQTVEGLVYGLVFGTALGIWLENFIINKKVLKQSTWKEGFLLILPSILATLIIYSSGIWITLALAGLLIVSGYLLFIRTGDFNLKVLLFG
ncbi:MAG: lipopolysaccharide biosynthesis protein [Bacteroidetes bacterium]|nr:MAG: lipopolysaccharide biosynthesis protein [Bacteroidota bacterium]